VYQKSDKTEMSISLKSKKQGSNFGFLRGSIVFGVPVIVVFEILLVYVTIP